MSSLNSDMVRIYLQEIGRYPMLTPEQEIGYARLVQQMIAIEQHEDALAQQLHRRPTMTELATDVHKSETEIAHILEQGQRAKQKMVTANLRLVVSVAKKYQHRNLEFLDLIQEGTLGLQKGVEKFDPNRGYKFSTYAYWWIRQEITRAIAEKSRTIRLPTHLTEILNKIKKVQREMFQKLGRHATVTEIAQTLNLQPIQVREYLSVSKQPVSLDLRVGDNQDTQLLDILPDESISSDERLTKELLRLDLNHMLASLTPTQREVIILRFGLENDHSFSLAQIGERLNLSRERIRQIESKAIKILRQQESDIREYLVG